MKKILLILLFIPGLLTYSQVNTIQIAGTVVDLSAGSTPVQGWEVNVLAYSNSIGFSYENTLTTDSSGIFSGIVPFPPVLDEVLLRIHTYDTCKNEYIEYTEIITDDTSLFYVIGLCEEAPQNCAANFTYYADSLNELTVYFNDQSTTFSGGPPTNLFWEFGDGSVSLMQNPQHTFSEQGTYLVCLTIIDTLDLCYDQLCKEITVGNPQQPLSAGFEYSLDSLLSIPNLYYFKSTSAGDIENWTWDFGDGNTAEGPEVSHRYEEQGTYTVCLTVESSASGNLQSDTHCEVITSPEYTYFGGQVFAGNFPLNNPIHTGDTGIAFLFKIHENTVVPVDTNQFISEGLYAFNHLLDGNYMVKVRLTKNSTNYGNYFPTYYPDRLMWQESPMMTLYEPVYSANIHLVPVPGHSQGPGSISGNVSLNINETELSHKGPDQFEVLLTDGTGNPLKYLFTDGSGSFGFYNLPYGTYRVFADHTGWASTSQTITLAQNNITADNVSLELDFQGSFTIKDPFISTEPEMNLYPNPVKDVLNLSFNSPEQGIYSISIIDPAGRLLQGTSLNMEKGKAHASIRTSDLPGGIYLLRLNGLKGRYQSVKRFVK